MTTPATTFEPRSFDHAALARLPEYHAFRKAMSDLANAAGAADLDLTADTIHEATCSSYAGDWCDCCRDEHATTDPTCWPFAARVEDGYLRGVYRCPRTGRTWTCSYTADLEFIAMLP